MQLPRVAKINRMIMRARMSILPTIYKALS